MIDIALLESIVQSPFVWSLLTLILAYMFYKNQQTQKAEMRSHYDAAQAKADAREQAITKLYEDHKVEANEREAKLMKHLDRTSETMRGIEKGINKLESRVDGGFNDIWAHINQLRTNNDDDKPSNGGDK